MTDGEGVAANGAEWRRWNDLYWTSAWPRREQLTGSVTDRLLSHLRLRPGEHVLDVGCGGGRTSIAAGSLVGPDGAVVGADLSEILLTLARERAEEHGAANVGFVQADMQVTTVGGGPFDVVMSQFGVMFFDEPATAFANLLAQVRGGGRLGFVCWQAARRNPWNTGAALAAFVPQPPPPAPGKTLGGPFSFGDVEQTSAMLRSAGWINVACTPYEARVTITRDALTDDAQPAFMGVPEDRLPEARVVIEQQLAPFELADGRYNVPIAYQVFTALSP